MRVPLGLGLILTLTLTELVGSSVAQAATAECMSPDGACEVSNDAGDFVECECSDGTGVAGGGTDDWAGLSELELQPICEEQLASLCGPPPPPDGIPCASPLGSCVIDNDPEDMLTCECADGSGGGLLGGNMWAGLSDMELGDQCEIELASFCGGGPPPPPPALECSSRLGACAINNEPIDFLECVCASGDEFEGGGGNEWARYSEEELLMECEEELANGCAVSSETGDTGDTGEPGDTGDTGTGSEGSTGGAGSTGTPGDTGIDDSGGASEGSSSGGVTPTTGDDATGGASEGSDGGADGGDGGSSGGCSVAARGAPGGWALVLLGLVGVGWRRRRAA